MWRVPVNAVSAWSQLANLMCFVGWGGGSLLGLASLIIGMNRPIDIYGIPRDERATLGIGLIAVGVVQLIWRMEAKRVD